MNARAPIHEFDRIRGDLGSALRIENELERPPRSLAALLKNLETRVREAEGERLFAEVDACVAELLQVVRPRFKGPN
jgi:hypothetical protein